MAKYLALIVLLIFYGYSQTTLINITVTSAKTQSSLIEALKHLGTNLTYFDTLF
jgi:hypothetical protein